MTFGRVVLIGDAAFVARPHVGMGVTKGAADARALADALSGDDIEDGLRAFNAKRKPIGDRVFARGRELGAFLNDDFEGALDEKHQNDLLRNTAADHFLHQQSEERRP
jgi:2-polyprenyl-6-methoxyphenol hydroxylase-like FAD-dependent oxidoreductase